MLGDIEKKKKKTQKSNILETTGLSEQLKLMTAQLEKDWTNMACF